MRTPLTTKKVKEALRSGPFAWPGCYPLFFITNDGAALSFKAVRDEWRQVCNAIRTNTNDGWQVVAVDVNYEDASLYCDHTGERIGSAYAEDEVEERSEA